MIGGFIAVLAIVIFVVAHEAGHFIAAKATGMKATEFFFGFGPRLWSFRKGETEYGVKAIPAGGYVRILGMNPFEEIAPEDMGRTYREKPFWMKSVVVLAGVGMNFLLAYLIFFGLVMSTGITEVVPEVNSVVEEVEGEPTAAATAGLLAGDRIVAVDGVPQEDWEDLAETLASRPDTQVELTIARDGETLDLTATLGSRVNEEGERAGFLGFEPVVAERSAGVFEGLGLAGQEVWSTIGLTFQFLGELVRPESLMQLAGVFVGETEVRDEIRVVSPIGVANLGSQIETLGVARYVALLGAINVILATFNVIPLLPLDGGHFALAAWQKVTGREPDVRRLVPIAVAVIILFTFIGLAAIILDIVNPIRV